jgi:hypothetical protein
MMTIAAVLAWPKAKLLAKNKNLIPNPSPKERELEFGT